MAVDLYQLRGNPDPRNDAFLAAQANKKYPELNLNLLCQSMSLFPL